MVIHSRYISRLQYIPYAYFENEYPLKAIILNIYKESIGIFDAEEDMLLNIYEKNLEIIITKWEWCAYFKIRRNRRGK